MSYFPTADAHARLPEGVVSDVRPDQAVAEGARLERRSLLRLSATSIAAALAFASCGATGRSGGALAADEASGALGPDEASDGLLEVGELLLELQPLAREQLSTNGTREEAYLMAVGQLLARLRTPTIPELRGAMGGYMQEHGEAGLEFYVTMFDLEAGKGFSHHDHRDYNGVILGVDGEVRIRNYDIVGDELVPPAGATFQIRQTRDDLILPGRFSSLGRARENVHDVTAGAQGGRVLDAFTFYRPDGQSYFMDVDETPRDAERGIFDAAWTG